MTDRVARIEAFPLVSPLAGGGYGSARGRVRERAATVVRLTTASGVHGWGEAFGPPRVMVPLIQEAGEAVEGHPVDEVRPVLAQLRQQTYHRGGSGLHLAAAGAVDTAAWDALGRALGISAARLLGGRARDEVMAYASTGYVTETADLGGFRESVEDAVERGYRGAKIKLGLGIREDRRRAEVARDALGPDRALMVDFNGNYTADLAVQALDALADLQLAWAEEPVPPEDLAGVRRVAARTSVPLAAGEAVYTRHGFRALLDTAAVAVVQPDIGKCGGLTESYFVAGLAQTQNIRVSPHCWGGAVGLAATLQLLAAVPDYPHPVISPQPLWFEHDQGENPLRDRLCVDPPAVSAGRIAIPDGPGLGVDVDERAVRSWAGGSS